MKIIKAQINQGHIATVTCYHPDESNAYYNFIITEPNDIWNNETQLEWNDRDREAIEKEVNPYGHYHEVEIFFEYYNEEVEGSGLYKKFLMHI